MFSLIRFYELGQGSPRADSITPTTCYPDLLLFNGERSIELIRGAVAASGLPAGIELHYFASHRRKDTVVF